MILSHLQTFKAAIIADTSQTVNVTANNHIAIAAYYNGAGTGTIWNPAIPVSALNTAIVWSEYAALTVAKQNTYQAMIASGFVDATSANIRAGFSTVFSGLTSLTNLTALAQRTPTRAEMVFTASQVCSLYGFMVSPNDVAQALGS